MSLPEIQRLSVADRQPAVGGGFPTITDIDTQTAAWLEDIYLDLSRNDTVDPVNLNTVWEYVQGQSAAADQGGPAFKVAPASRSDRLAELAAYFKSDKANAIAPAEPLNLNYPMASYFVSSSHNTYLSGNQLSSYSSTEEYKNVLRRGCRCVEIDVWDGDSDSDSECEAELEGGTQQSEKKSFGRFRNKFFRPKQGKEPETVSSAATDPVPGIKPSQPLSQKVKAIVEPMVYHGYTITTKITFRSVCETLRDHAFESTSLPLIVSLEVHTCHQQQQLMVDIMKSVFHGLLVEEPDEHTDDVLLPTIADLQNKILIKVKYTSPQKAKDQAKEIAMASKDAAKDKGAAGKQPVGPNITAELMEESNDEEPDGLPVDTKRAADAKKPAKIIEALGRLGFYTRSFHFHNFAQPEAKIPTHIFSLSEGAVSAMHKKDPVGLWLHNREYMMRTYPSGTRISSSNADPILFWRRGIQIVALNWQKIDGGMMLNNGMFTGTPGWVLKPPFFRGIPRSLDQEMDSATEILEAMKHGHILPDSSLSTLDLKITFYCGQDIPLPTDEKAADFRPYVKCELHVESEPVDPDGTKAIDGPLKGKVQFAKKKTAVRTSPNFGRQVVEWNSIPRVVPELAFVRFKVKDYDLISSDDLAGWSCIRLDRLRNGYRFVHLYDDRGRPTKGVLLVRIEKKMR